MEKTIAFICFLAGTAFLVAAIFIAWRYFFTMGICYAAGILVNEDAHSK